MFLWKKTCCDIGIIGRVGWPAMEPSNPKKKHARSVPRAIIIPEGRQPFASQCFQNSSIWCRLKKSPLAKTGTCRWKDLEVEWVGYCWKLVGLGWGLHTYWTGCCEEIYPFRGIYSVTVNPYTLRKAHWCIGFSHVFSKCFKVKVKKINNITKDEQIRHIWYIHLPAKKVSAVKTNMFYMLSVFQTSVSFYWFKVNIYSTQCILCHPSNRNEWNPKRDHLNLFSFNRIGKDRFPTTFV